MTKRCERPSAALHEQKETQHCADPLYALNTAHQHKNNTKHTTHDFSAPKNLEVAPRRTTNNAVETRTRNHTIHISFSVYMSIAIIMQINNPNSMAYRSKSQTLAQNHTHTSDDDCCCCDAYPVSTYFAYIVRIYNMIFAARIWRLRST